MSRIRTPFVSGTILNNPLAIGGTSLSSAALASLPAIASPDIAVIVLDPAGAGGTPEVAWITAHSASATTATILRAQEGTTARAHNLNTPWIHAPTTYDFQETYGTQLTAASNLVLPVSDHEKFFVVSGTTPISTISARPIGSRIYLQFLSDIILTWTASTNGLIWPAVSGISNNIIAKSDEILEFVFTAANRWYLVARSVAGGGSWQLHARNSAEFGATNAGAPGTDVANITSLNIPVDKWVRVTGQWRRNNGAEAVTMGYKLNSTVITNNFFNSSTAGNISYGTFQILIPPRDAAYPRAWGGSVNQVRADTNAGNIAWIPSNDQQDLPIATITSIAMRVGGGGTGVTSMYFKNIIVEIL